MRLFERINNKKIISYISLLVVMSMCLVGCGKKEEDIPELIEPVVTNSSYRPVSYGDIGKQVIKTASVVPTEYCYFYNSNVTISKLYVNVGDYVEAGTVLAEADSEEIDSGMEEISETLSKQKTLHELNQKIFNESQKELDWKIKACEEVGDEDGAAEYRLEKATAAENNRYDNMLYEYQLNKTQKSYDEQSELQEDGTLTADHSGYVTYVKSIVEENGVSGGENVVIISDINQPYIEITGEKVKRGAYDVFKNMYTVIDGKRYEIETYDYTNQELAVAQSMSSIPDVRFKLKDGNKSLLKAGSTLSLYFTTSEIINVLIIGNDSLYEENGKTFVYVKTENNDKERRDITIGESDDNYTQVVDGLKEGELVYYLSDSIMPASYVEYEVTLGNFTKSGTSKKFSMEDRNMVMYSAPCEGYFNTFDLVEGQEVKKGDLLFSIDSGGGSAAVKEIDIQIAEENSSYNEMIAGYDEQIKSLSKQISDWKSGKLPDRTASPGDAEENTLYMAEQLTCQKQIASYNKQIATVNYNANIASLNKQREKLNKNNDGSGNISVYAEQDGFVKSVAVATDVKLEEGQNIVSIGSEENVIMALSLTDDESGGEAGSLQFNQPVTVVNNTDDSIKFKGKCIGTTANTAKAYISTDKDGEVHVTKSSGTEGTKYFIEVEDKKFYEQPKAYSVKYAKESLENVILIPANMIYHEVEKTSGREYDYVWKVMDGQLVKQYITIGSGDETQKTILSGLNDGDIIAKETAE
ncbi:MAG: efflux RND transporter periplasmic adaptor subunit [Coprococcus sp.]|nr:efflux RND transporter periplasmic adaptor subunit [Coprococcus sp.]